MLFFFVPACIYIIVFRTQETVFFCILYITASIVLFCRSLFYTYIVDINYTVYVWGVLCALFYIKPR